MRVLYFIGQLFFIPHVLLFEFSSTKKVIIKDLYARKLKTNKGFTLWNNLTFELVTNKYFRTLFYFRINNLYAKFLSVFYTKHASFTIDRYTKIGEGLKLAHPYSTIIHAESVGENVYINHLVTIGEKKGKKPIIGNNVEIHAHAIVIGGIVIGDNATIGAGAVVVKDVPEKGIVVGNPARIIGYNSI